MSKDKTVKYYIFKFKLNEYQKFCEQCNLIDTHILLLGYDLTEQEKEMQYALDKFLKGFNCQGHDITEFCIIPKTIFNESCIYEHVGHKVYLISPVFLTDRNLVEYKYPQLVSEVYKEDIQDLDEMLKEEHRELSEKQRIEIEEIVKDLYGEDVIDGQAESDY